MRRLIANLCASLLLALVAIGAIGQEVRGFLGFAVEVDGEGPSLNPILRSVTIVSVAKPSPASSAGISPRDQIVEIDGHAVPGAKGSELEPLLKKAPGETVRLKLRRPSSEEYSVTLVAVPRPAQP